MVSLLPAYSILSANELTNLSPQGLDHSEHRTLPPSPGYIRTRVVHASEWSILLVDRCALPSRMVASHLLRGRMAQCDINVQLNSRFCVRGGRHFHVHGDDSAAGLPVDKR